MFGAEGDAAESTSGAPLDDLDADLLEGLGLDALDDLAPTKPSPRDKERTVDTPPTSETGRDALDDDLLRDLGLGEDVDAAGEDDDPLQRLFREMRAVEERIAKSDTSDETRARQKRIIEEIDKLIEQARQNGSNSSPSSSRGKHGAKTGSRERTASSKAGSKSSSGSRPSAGPSADSAENLREMATQRPDMSQMHNLLKDVWGELPPRLREQLLQSSIDEFLPRYELMIEEYFKNLARRQQGSP